MRTLRFPDVKLLAHHCTDGNGAGRAEVPNTSDTFRHLLSQSKEQSTQGSKLQSADWVKNEGPQNFQHDGMEHLVVPLKGGTCG